MSAGDSPCRGEELLARALQLGPGQAPFPWQVRLLECFLDGNIPRSLDVPTGLGKTATIAIWLVARVLGAPMPRRLVYVVDRRAVVDQATTVAERLREWIASEPALHESLGLVTPASAELKERRCSLPISTLRGQYVDNREWLEDPARSGIVVGTVDMVGSRLLFEGYGCSRRMRPYMAGLLAVDTLFALDEAHLVPPFEALVERVCTDVETFGPRETPARGVVPRAALLALSATGRAHGGEVFDLNENDLSDPVVHRRLHATKRIRLVESWGDTTLPEELAARAWELSEHGRQPVRCVVFVNKREEAEEAADKLTSMAGLDKLKKGEAASAEVELLTGARRVYERTEAARRLDELGFVAGSENRLGRPCFLFATSAGEVGVDLDADHMVCDLVAWERMVQRLGRVNRRGGGAAEVTVLVEPLGEKASDVERARWGARLAAIRSLPGLDDGAFDGSPMGLRGLARRGRVDAEVASMLQLATTPPPQRPALDRATVEAWAMTSLVEHAGRPEVAPWLRGWEERRPQTRVVWRARLPLPKDRAPLDEDLQRYFAAAPPHTSEVLETETYRVVEWLSNRIKKLRKSMANAQPDDQNTDDHRLVAFVLNGAGELEQSWTFTQLERVLSKKGRARDRVFLDRIVVLDASVGGLARGLLDANSDEPPDTADGETWLRVDKGEAPVPRFRIREVGAEEDAVEDAYWRERERLPLAYGAEEEVERWLVIEKWKHDAATEEDRSAGRPQLLDEHERWAAACARNLADRIGLPPELVTALTIAARLHDEGKQSRRWQRAFRAPSDGVWAKTRGPIDVHLLDGYRHEFGSLRYVDRDPEFRALSESERDLVLHLVAAHHGFARPLIRTDGCEDAPPTVLRTRAREVALRFFRLQHQWGPWGLAWLEALLRAADQEASRRNDDRDVEVGHA